MLGVNPAKISEIEIIKHAAPPKITPIFCAVPANKLFEELGSGVAIPNIKSTTPAAASEKPTIFKTKNIFGFVSFLFPPTPLFYHKTKKIYNNLLN